MVDPILLEALYRGLRAIALVTGALVAVDSISVLFKPVEYPPHHPKWNAGAWLAVSIAAVLVAGYLTIERYGLIEPTEPPLAKFAPVVLYLGLILAFTVRAISRAERPWLTVISSCCMSIMAVGIAWWDLVV